VGVTKEKGKREEEGQHTGITKKQGGCQFETREKIFTPLKDGKEVTDATVRRKVWKKPGEEWKDRMIRETRKKERPGTQGKSDPGVLSPGYA